MNNTRVVIGIGVIAVVTIISVILFIRMKHEEVQPMCMALDSPKDSKRTLIGSNDNKALFNGTLYLGTTEKKDDKTTTEKYVLLTTNIITTDATDFKSPALVNLTFDCGQLKLKYGIDVAETEQTNTLKTYKELKRAELFYNVGKVSGSCLLNNENTDEKCSIFNKIDSAKHANIVTKDGKASVYPCKDDKGVEVVKLYVQQYEIEFGRDAQAKRGEFETEKESCSPA